MKDFFSDRRNIIIISCICLIILVSLIILFLVRNTDSYKKKSYENDLTNMARDFYENFYYDLIVDSLGKEQISRFKDNGIEINLTTLSKRSLENRQKIDSFIRVDNNEKCNYDTTKAIIYPKENYEKQDYEIEIVLDCGFKEE